LVLHCTGAAAVEVVVAVGRADPALAETSSATSAPAASTVFLRIILLLREAALRSQACVRTRITTGRGQPTDGLQERGDVLVMTW
jgi:hypothetical protein